MRDERRQQPSRLAMRRLGNRGAMLAEPTLSFLHLGVQPPKPSWRSTLAEAQECRQYEVAHHRHATCHTVRV